MKDAHRDGGNSVGVLLTMLHVVPDEIKSPGYTGTGISCQPDQGRIVEAPMRGSSPWR
jgi:phosphotransferase system IIA component